MSLRDKNFFPREYYHIYNRGNNKQKIFLDEEDYRHFEKLLYVCNSRFNFSFKNSIVSQKIDAFSFDRDVPIVSVLSWVLMPNHFHILLCSDRDDLWEENYNPITEYMRKISTAYVMYFNKKHKRSGTIFQGKFKSKHIGEENYFNYIFSYIYLNPIKLIEKNWKTNRVGDIIKISRFLDGYKHSSYEDFFEKKEKRKESRIIETEKIPKHVRNFKTNDLLNGFYDFQSN